MRRLILLAATTLAALSATVAPAAAKIDSGQGLLGENNDLMVTLFGFAVLLGIPAFAGLASLLQWRLDKRKDARMAAAKKRRASSDKRLGW